jgi:hypothetical protein
MCTVTWNVQSDDCKRSSVTKESVFMYNSLFLGVKFYLFISQIHASLTANDRAQLMHHVRIVCLGLTVWGAPWEQRSEW